MISAADGGDRPTPVPSTRDSGGAAIRDDVPVAVSIPSPARPLDDLDDLRFDPRVALHAELGPRSRPGPVDRCHDLERVIVELESSALAVSSALRLALFALVGLAIAMVMTFA